MSPVDVTVVIPTYRRERLLLESVASACSQRGVAVEVIVVDDSPEGSAGEAVHSLKDARVRYLHRAVPSGGRPGAVRNDGVRLARAPLIHFLDDDDRLVEGCLADLRAALSAKPSAMAFGRVLPFGDDVRILETERVYFEKGAAVARRLRGRHWFAAQLLFREMILINSACMMRREAFERHGGYDPDLRCCEDVDLFLRVARQGGFTFVDRDVLHYRVGAPSIMNELRRTGSTAEANFVRTSYGKMHARYKREHGILEYRTLQALSRATRLFGPRAKPGGDNLAVNA